MGELSDRFAELMARMAKGDAELFRTVGEQNAALRELVDELAPVPVSASLSPASDPVGPAALTPLTQPLLPLDQCDPAALKARFGTVAAAHAHLEATLGPAPSKKKTWQFLGSVFEQGSWPAPVRPQPSSRSPAATARNDARNPAPGAASLEQLEARLMERIDQMEQRLIRVIETLALRPL